MDIKELRKSKKLTQTALARALGLKESAVAAIETGRRKLTEDIIAKIKESFGVEIDAEVKTAGKKETARKTAVKAGGAAAKGILFIQSPLGGQITPEEILARIGDADAIYVRVDENKAYWVKGTENGSIDLW